MDESEDPRQHRGADLSQRGRAGFGHAGQQGDGYLNRAHVIYNNIYRLEDDNYLQQGGFVLGFKGPLWQF